MRLFAILLLLSVTLSACGAASSAPPTVTAVASQQKTRQATPIPGTYVALGASETYGVGANPYTRGYAYLVRRMLGASHFRDTGIPGATLNQAYDTEVTTALAARPALCTLFFGFNDLRQQVRRGPFLADLRDLAVTLHRGGANVLIIGLPDLSLLPATRAFGGLHAIVQSWNAGMRQVARETGSRFLDLSRFSRELASHPGYIASDGLHPSNQGHARLAVVVAQAIKQDGLWQK